MSNNFVHLHVHSEYSLLDGAAKVEHLVSRAKELGMDALALTDHGNMFGAVKFFKTCREEGIKPIIGMESYVSRSNRFEKGKKGDQSQLDHLVLIAKDNDGYKNLIYLSSIGYIEGFYYKPRIDLEVLAERSTGLIGLSSCIRGVVPRAALERGVEQAIEKAEALRDLFGEGNFFLEIQDHGIEEETQIKEMFKEISQRTGIPLVATNDAHYLRKEDAEAHEVLLCVQTGGDLEDPNRFHFQTSELYLKSEEEMRRLFSDVPESLDVTASIANRCNVDLSPECAYLPSFPLPENYSSDADYLRYLAFEGAKARFEGVSDEVKDRLEYELSVVKRMGFPGYFLIVRDIVNFAKDNKIPVGPGRGSAAGSLVSYCLGITDVNPLEHDLLFERLLNPERITLPDIDIDFCYERRDEVIRYIIERYSKDNVCQIITFGTMAARGVIRDVGRVLKISLPEVDKIAKLIPAQPGTSLTEALEKVPELKSLINENPEYKKLMRLSLTLEGLTRHASTHAAGVIITPTPLINHLPLYRKGRHEITSQYDMKSAEYVGLLKIDILGLRTLTVIAKAIAMIAENHGIHLKAEEIPVDDEKTFVLLKQAKTVGVFQLESAGMRELLKNLEPESFHDIVAVNALYRPGPIEGKTTNYFVECKRGKKKIKYEHPLLEPILKETYGVILYQEQVMRIASSLAGFSMGAADLLRSAMGKKKLDVMARQREQFIEGAKQNKIPKSIAQKIFGLMEKFALYGFNKSHSTAYAIISVRTAYLKAHYPAEFMAATLTSEMDKTDRILTLLDECRELGLEVIPPEINTCCAEFRAVGGKIVYGLAAVKNVGTSAIKHIIEERDNNGPYRSLPDLASRVSTRIVNKKVLESLIQAGAMDRIPGHRAQKIFNLERILERAQRSPRAAQEGQFSFTFSNAESLVDETLHDTEPWSPQEQLRKEQESLGFFLTGHPLDKFKDILPMLGTMTTSQLKSGPNGKYAVISGLITGVKALFDKKNNPMAFVMFEDGEGQAEAVVFSDVLEKHRKNIQQGSVLLMEGKVSCRNGGEGKLLLNSATQVDDNRIPPSKEIHITIDLDRVEEEAIEGVKQILGDNKGQTKVFFHMKESGRKKCVIRSRSISVNIDREMLLQLSGVIGAENVKLTPGFDP